MKYIHFLNSNGAKICAKCKKVKPHSMFRKVKRTWDGYITHCFACTGKLTGKEIELEDKSIACDENSKFCCSCHKIKSIDMFYKKKREGTQSICKDCTIEVQKKIRAKGIVYDVETKGEKRCHKCKEVKSVNEFWKNKKAKGGRCTYCIKCSTKKQNTDFVIKPITKKETFVIKDGEKTKKCYSCRKKININKFRGDSLFCDFCRI